MPPASPLRGIALLVAAVLCFVLLDSTSKSLSQHWPVSLVVWIRYSVHLALMTILLAPRHGLRLIATRRPGLQVLRALCLLVTSWFIVAALARMPLAETTAIIFTAPLLVTLLARFMLGEQVSALRWLAVGIGFAGVLVMVRPDSAALPAAGIALAFIGACGFALYQVLTRTLSPTERPLTLLYYTALVGTAGMTVALPWYWGGPIPNAPQMLLMLAMGCLGGLGHFLLIRAFSLAPASLLSPILYVQLAWATLIGWLLFDQLPDPARLAGITIIAAAGVLTAVDARRRPT
ncbi:MAG: DMT family transporter [Rhodocyclaceae bacterium]|nr:DMT family transporter [Rhodocyclaceae bacterium]